MPKWFGSNDSEIQKTKSKTEEEKTGGEFFRPLSSAQEPAQSLAPAPPPGLSPIREESETMGPTVVFRSSVTPSMPKATVAPAEPSRASTTSPPAPLRPILTAQPSKTPLPAVQVAPLAAMAAAAGKTPGATLSPGSTLGLPPPARPQSQPIQDQLPLSVPLLPSTSAPIAAPPSSTLPSSLGESRPPTLQATAAAPNHPGPPPGQSASHSTLAALGGPPSALLNLLNRALHKAGLGQHHKRSQSLTSLPQPSSLGMPESVRDVQSGAATPRGGTHAPSLGSPTPVPLAFSPPDTSRGGTLPLPLTVGLPRGNASRDGQAFDVDRRSSPPTIPLTLMSPDVATSGREGSRGGATRSTVTLPVPVKGQLNGVQSGAPKPSSGTANPATGPGVGSPAVAGLGDESRGVAAPGDRAPSPVPSRPRTPSAPPPPSGSAAAPPSVGPESVLMPRGARDLGLLLPRELPLESLEGTVAPEGLYFDPKRVVSSTAAFEGEIPEAPSSAPLSVTVRCNRILCLAPPCLVVVELRPHARRAMQRARVGRCLLLDNYSFSRGAVEGQLLMQHMHLGEDLSFFLEGGPPALDRLLADLEETSGRTWRVQAEAQRSRGDVLLTALQGALGTVQLLQRKAEVLQSQLGAAQGELEVIRRRASQAETVSVQTEAVAAKEEKGHAGEEAKEGVSQPSLPVPLGSPVPAVMVSPTRSLAQLASGRDERIDVIQPPAFLVVSDSTMGPIPFSSPFQPPTSEPGPPPSLPSADRPLSPTVEAASSTTPTTRLQASSVGVVVVGPLPSFSQGLSLAPGTEESGAHALPSQEAPLPTTAAEFESKPPPVLESLKGHGLEESWAKQLKSSTDLDRQLGIDGAAGLGEGNETAFGVGPPAEVRSSSTALEEVISSPPGPVLVHEPDWIELLGPSSRYPVPGPAQGGSTGGGHNGKPPVPGHSRRSSVASHFSAASSHASPLARALASKTPVMSPRGPEEFDFSPTAQGAGDSAVRRPGPPLPPFSPTGVPFQGQVHGHHHRGASRPGSTASAPAGRRSSGARLSGESARFRGGRAMLFGLGATTARAAPGSPPRAGVPTIVQLAPDLQDRGGEESTGATSAGPSGGQGLLPSDAQLREQGVRAFLRLSSAPNPRLGSALLDSTSGTPEGTGGGEFRSFDESETAKFVLESSPLAASPAAQVKVEPLVWPTLHQQTHGAAPLAAVNTMAEAEFVVRVAEVVEKQAAAEQEGQESEGRHPREQTEPLPGAMESEEPMVPMDEDEGTRTAVPQDEHRPEPGTGSASQAEGAGLGPALDGAVPEASRGLAGTEVEAVSARLETPLPTSRGGLALPLPSQGQSEPEGAKAEEQTRDVPELEKEAERRTAVESTDRTAPIRPPLPSPSAAAAPSPPSTSARAQPDPLLRDLLELKRLQVFGAFLQAMSSARPPPVPGPQAPAQASPSSPPVAAPVPQPIIIPFPIAAFGPSSQAQTIVPGESEPPQPPRTPSISPVSPPGRQGTLRESREPPHVAATVSKAFHPPVYLQLRDRDQPRGPPVHVHQHHAVVRGNASVTKHQQGTGTRRGLPPLED